MLAKLLKNLVKSVAVLATEATTSPRPQQPAALRPGSSFSPASTSDMPESAAFTPRLDPQLNRNVVEITRDGVTYRIPARLGAEGRYEITGILSVGGFGVIYQGCDRRLFHKKVLIKAIRYRRRHLSVPNNHAVLADIAEQRQRFQHERKMLLAGYRRGIAGMPLLLDVVTDFGLDLRGPHQDMAGNSHYYELDEQWRTEPYLVLSYIDGQPMSKVLNQTQFNHNRLGNTKQVILQIGRMLKEFHQEEIINGKAISFVYQDLKPDNIIFSREKQPILIDCGGFAVRVNGETGVEFARTGTPGYQPPEFINGTPIERIDGRADVFSLGMTIYHLLSGVAPKADAQGYSIVDPAVMQQLQQPWREWIEQAIQPNPHQRFATLDQAIDVSHKLPLK